MGAQLAEQDYEQVRLDAVRPHPDNPRKGNVSEIEESIRANGFYGALIVQKSTGYVLAGNHRYLAAAAVGLDTVPVVWVDVEDDVALRILLADNRTSDTAGYDEEALLVLLEEIDATAGLAGTGYDADALEDLRAALEKVPTLPPLATDAAYAESPEEEAERASHRGQSPSIHETGLREVIFVYPYEDHADVLRCIATLRAGRQDITSSQVVHDVLRKAAAAV